MILIIIFLIFAILVLCGFIFAGIAVYPRVIPYEETRRREIEAGKIRPDVFYSWPREEIFIQSPYGYRLHGLYFPQPGSNKTVVIVHGINWSLFGSVKYMPNFRKRGFNHRFWRWRGWRFLVDFLPEAGQQFSQTGMLALLLSRHEHGYEPIYRFAVF